MGTVRPNTRVVDLQESHALEAALDVPESSPAQVREGDLVRLWVEGVPQPFESRVRAVSDRIDERGTIADDLHDGRASKEWSGRIPPECISRAGRGESGGERRAGPRTVRGPL